jgi:PKD repeat protein
MNKKNFLLLCLAMLMMPGLFAQALCTSPPDCIINGDLVTNGATTGDMWGAATPAGHPQAIPGWYVSFGTPSIWSTAPGNPGNALWMWAYSGPGEGIFTCFNFQPGKTYKVCMMVKNTNIQTGGSLMVVAANGLTRSGGLSSTSQQVINGNPHHDPNWVQVSYEFTANQAYSQLSIYPYWSGTPGAWNNYRQYELIVDDIRVMEIPTLSVSGFNPVGPCDSMILSLNNIPPDITSITWSPAAGLNTTTGSTVVARPCSTTTYTATIAGSGSCPTCPATYNYTVFVQDQGQLVNHTPNVTCLGPIDLEFDGNGCTPVTFDWKGPNGTTISTSPTVSIPMAGDADAGGYSLTVTYANGCSYSYNTSVNVSGCCDVVAGININGCNPVRFEDATSGSAGGQAVGWIWDLGDGTTSTLQNPAHLYTTQGTVTVCLTTIYEKGNLTCCDKICKQHTICGPVNCMVKSSFGVSDINPANHSAQFTDHSAGNQTPCGYMWDFGDGTPPDFTQNPTHTFPGPGTYRVCFTASHCDAGGNQCKDMWCEDVIIP